MGYHNPDYKTKSLSRQTQILFSQTSQQVSHQITNLWVSTRWNYHEPWTQPVDTERKHQKSNMQTACFGAYSSPHSELSPTIQQQNFLPCL